MRLTEEERSTIRAMRVEGLGYLRIANSMGISVNTVRSFCRRNKINGPVIKKDGVIPCKGCGRPIQLDQRRKGTKFCSDNCRMRWWSRNRDKLKKKAIYEFTCANCGNPFTAYGNPHRKFCTHDCYIQARFGETRSNTLKGDTFVHADEYESDTEVLYDN